MKKIILVTLLLLTIIAAIVYYLVSPYSYGNLDRPLLDESLKLGTSFLLNNQKPQGNFNYETDLLTGELADGDSPVRQAGAFWGLALIHHDNPNRKTYNALVKALKFFLRNSANTDSTMMFVNYPGTSEGRTGTMALVCLACIEMMSAGFSGEYDELIKNSFEKYFKFLLSLKNQEGRFFSSYNYTDGGGYASPSPYFDGEALLAMVKAARYADKPYLKEDILLSANEMYHENVVYPLKTDNDSPVTKGFYQWGSMAFYEIFTAGWDSVYAERVIEMACWMIDVHRTLWRMKNTAYAHEGMISAWETARIINDQKSLKKIGKVINKGLYKLTTWQVGSSVENQFLKKNITTNPMLSGGVMNCRNCPLLRIDVTQHQMHAVILARRFIYID